jgi:hypothetical protein
MKRLSVIPRIRGGEDPDEIPEEIRVTWNEAEPGDETWIAIVKYPAKDTEEWLMQAWPEGGMQICNERGETHGKCTECIGRSSLVESERKKHQETQARSGTVRAIWDGRVFEGSLTKKSNSVT